MPLLALHENIIKYFKGQVALHIVDTVQILLLSEIMIFFFTDLFDIDYLIKKVNRDNLSDEQGIALVLFEVFLLFVLVRFSFFVH